MLISKSGSDWEPWVSGFIFSWIGDKGDWSSMMAEIRMICEKITECEFLGIVWKTTQSYRNIHSGMFYVIIDPKVAVMIKLAGTGSVCRLSEIL